MSRIDARPGSPTGSAVTKVLIVEDQPPVANYMRRLLNRAARGQFDATMVDSLQKATEYLAEHDVAVVLLDLGLPDSQGSETVRRMHEAAPALPIVVVTAQDDHGLFFEALRQGAQEYLVKDTLNTELLARAVRYAIDRKHDEDQRERAHNELRRLNAHLQHVREEERTRISREIHDQLGQTLTALRMEQARLQTLISRMPECHGRDEAQTKLEGMSSLIADTVTTVRSISAELRPGVLDDLGLAAAVEWELRQFQKRTGLNCDVRFDPPNPPVPEPAATQLFRIFQETLTNVARHANAGAVSVAVTLRNGRCELTVRDDGRGIPPEKCRDPASLGLLGMRERAELLGGTITINGCKGRGTTVLAAIPVGEDTADRPREPEK